MNFRDVMHEIGLKTLDGVTWSDGEVEVELASSPREESDNVGMTIRYFYSREVGRGNGYRMLEKICHCADKSATKLYLQPRPYRQTEHGAIKFGNRQGGLTKQQLIEWYSKFGFKKVNSRWMGREPK